MKLVLVVVIAIALSAGLVADSVSFDVPTFKVKVSDATFEFKYFTQRETEKIGFNGKLINLVKNYIKSNLLYIR